MTARRPTGSGGSAGGDSRWSFLRDAIDDLQRKQARFPARLFQPLSEWASRQEEKGLLRFWSPAAQPREAGDIWAIDNRDVRLDPFFLTSVLLHLLLALLLWQALSALPTPEPEEKKD